MTSNQEVSFATLINQMKDHLKKNKVSEAIVVARKALLIQPTEKLKKKLRSMEEFLAIEDDDDYDELTHLGQGFYLCTDTAKKLYWYQKDGLLWLWQLYLEGKGGILADDMGLGKTAQISSFLSAMFQLQKAKSVLVVSSLSLIPHWTKETAAWGPNLTVSNFHSATQIGRRRILEKVKDRGGILLLTFGLLISSGQQLAKDFLWDYVILDEGDKIKNTTKTTRAAHAIPARNRIVLTGTPIQNNLQELWSLFDFVHHGTLLGTSKSFHMEYELAITRSREKDATPSDKQRGTKIAEKLRNKIAPYFLRRTKAEVMSKKDNDGSLRPDELKRKNDFVIWTFLSQKQIKIYTDFLTSEEVQKALMSKKSPLVQLNIMKKICDHPRLLSAGACNALGLDDSQIQVDFHEGVDYEHVSDEILIKESGKLSFVIQLIKDFKAEGHRCLLFSRSRKILDMIERIIKSLGIRLMRIDGTVTKCKERQTRIDAFNKNKNCTVFLLTSQVCGVGFSITAANRVIIFDPSWNPATDSQAIDRCYRIGQKEAVIVYRLITCGTIEEKIYCCQIFKQSLQRQTTDGELDPCRYFSQQQIRDVFRLDDPTQSKTQVQLEKMHSVHRNTDEALDAHIARLYTFDIFGISDHDLMFTVHQADEVLHQMNPVEQLVQSNSSKRNAPIAPQPVMNTVSSDECSSVMDMSLTVQNVTLYSDEPFPESNNEPNDALITQETPENTNRKSLNINGLHVTAETNVSLGACSSLDTSTPYDANALLQYHKSHGGSSGGSSSSGEPSAEEDHLPAEEEKYATNAFFPSPTAETTFERASGDLTKETAMKLRRSSLFVHLLNEVEDESGDSYASFEASASDESLYLTMFETSLVVTSTEETDGLKGS